MSEPFAHFTGAGFDPLPASVAVDATASPAYTTPAEQRIQIKDLSRLSYIGARIRATVRLNQSTTSGSGTLKLTDGSNTLWSVTVDFTQGPHINYAADVDISAVAGSAGLRLVLDVGSAADSSTTAEVAGFLDIYHPLVLLSGCGG